MELTPYLEGLRRDLSAAAAPGGPGIQQAADLLVGSLEASARLFLLEALSDAAAEITAKLTDSTLGRITVEVRLRGRDAQMVVSEPGPPPAAAPAPPPAEATDSGDLARITLRLPEQLKETVERLAAAESISTNAWLVRAIAQIVYGAGPTPPPPGPAQPGRGRLSRRVTGYAQA
jgi:hypothetical protein